MTIKNLKKAANRISKAVKSREKIIIYGDADLDGVTAVIILKEVIQNLGEPSGGKYPISAIYFPEREKEGYGINKTALDFLKPMAPALLIALDCGIGNFQEVKIAKKLGFEVIIIDHHQVLDRLPEAQIIVDPKQKGDKYPFKEFATVGIVFKLSQLLLGKRVSEAMRKNFLELAALGTIADMMTEENENKLFIAEGLESLENSWRPGIREFLNNISFNPGEKNRLNLRQKISKIISILNVRDIENKMPASFRVLTISSLKEAEKIIEKLLEKNEVKKEKIKKITQEVEEDLSSSSPLAGAQEVEEDLSSSSPLAGAQEVEEGLSSSGKIIFEGKSDWELPLLSSVASIICNKYKKPTFLFKKGDRNSQGTVRIPKGLDDGVKAMMSCRQLLETYGGHSLAAGFSLKNENLKKFKECLNKYFK